jgi:hypothetical protein
MTRSLLHRLLGALCALWFAISVAEPALLHACPMHDGTAAGRQADHHVHGEATDTTPPDGTERAPCLCLGDCAAASAMGLAASHVGVVEVAVVASADAGLPDHAYVPVARALLLPFANGPPSSERDPRA